MTEPTEYRIEHDTMGEVRVPKDALYAAQTQRAVENFPISGSGLESTQIAALARIKKAAALANKELGTLDGAIADAIAWAADEVVTGAYDEHFPVDTYQTGSGTSSNMNMNEVLATLATRKLGAPVHPNDHVNASQSSNDVFPTSVHIAVTQALIDDLIPALDHLAVALEEKAEAWKSVVKSGRTHLMDATPVTLGQEFGGYARQMRLGIERVQSVLPRVGEVPLGGTAVGTGINTPLGFPQKVIALLAAETELPITEAKDHFEAQANRDGLVEASGALRTIAVSLTKINNDIRWMGSGPRAGLGELARLVGAAHAEDRAGIGVGRRLAGMSGDMRQRDGDGVFRPQAPFAPVIVLRQEDAAADILAGEVEEGLDRLQDRRLGAPVALALERRDHGLEL